MLDQELSQNDERNSHKDIYTLNPKVSDLNLYDAITQRLLQLKGLSSGGANINPNEINDDGTLRNYFWTMEVIIEEVHFLLEKLYSKLSKDKRNVNQA